jgi:hypothetical protein
MMISRRRSFRMIVISVLLIMALFLTDTSVSANNGLKGSGRTTTMQNTDSMNDTGEVEQIHRFLFIQDAITDFFNKIGEAIGLTVMIITMSPWLITFFLICLLPGGEESTFCASLYKKNPPVDQQSP